MKQKQQAKQPEVKPREETPTQEQPAEPMAAAEQPEKPRQKWQIGEYDYTQKVKFAPPYQFLLLCKLVQVPPMKMLHHFMTNVSGDNFNRAKEEGCRSQAVEYFIQCGYGQDFYTEPDIRQILKELDAMGALWPKECKMKMLERHIKWSEPYVDDYWFKKWRNKLKRKK